MIDELYGGRVATSTELAQLTGLTPSAMSYHMRALEKFGIVERDEEAADARERPWRAAGAALNVSSLTTRAQQAAAALLTGSVMDTMRRELDAYAGAEAGLPREWRGKANFDAGTEYLTADETRQLIAALEAAVAPFRTRRGRGRARDGARRVRVAMLVVPDAG